jgi:hypothetical protein
VCGRRCGWGVQVLVGCSGGGGGSCGQEACEWLAEATETAG